VELILSPTVLSNLRELALVHVDLKTFPDSLAASLTRLTALNLVANIFDHLPGTISQITTQVSLIMGGNNDLRLEDSDLDTLAALPNLRTLDIGKSELEPSINDDEPRCVWLQEDVAVIIEIARLHPKLNMLMTFTTLRRTCIFPF
jgi:hypothetical protein